MDESKISTILRHTFNAFYIYYVVLRYMFNARLKIVHNYHRFVHEVFINQAKNLIYIYIYKIIKLAVYRDFLRMVFDKNRHSLFFCIKNSVTACNISQ